MNHIFGYSGESLPVRQLQVSLQVSPHGRGPARLRVVFTKRAMSRMYFRLLRARTSIQSESYQPLSARFAECHGFDSEFRRQWEVLATCAPTETKK